MLPVQHIESAARNTVRRHAQFLSEEKKQQVIALRPLRSCKSKRSPDPAGDGRGTCEPRDFHPQSGGPVAHSARACVSGWVDNNVLHRGFGNSPSRQESDSADDIEPIRADLTRRPWLSAVGVRKTIQHQQSYGTGHYELLIPLQVATVAIAQSCEEA